MRMLFLLPLRRGNGNDKVKHTMTITTNKIHHADLGEAAKAGKVPWSWPLVARRVTMTTRKVKNQGKGNETKTTRVKRTNGGQM